MEKFWNCVFLSWEKANCIFKSKEVIRCFILWNGDFIFEVAQDATVVAMCWWRFHIHNGNWSVGVRTKLTASSWVRTMPMLYRIFHNEIAFVCGSYWKKFVFFVSVSWSRQSVTSGWPWSAPLVPINAVGCSKSGSKYSLSPEYFQWAPEEQKP